MTSQAPQALLAAMTPSQRTFCAVWAAVGMTGMSLEECYREAYPDTGPSDVRANAARLLRQPVVADYLQATGAATLSPDGVPVAQALTSPSAVASLEEIRENLTEISRADITEIVQWDVVPDDNGGETFLPRIKRFEEVPKPLRRMIKSITLTKQGPKFEMHDAMKATDMLVRMGGGYKDSVNVTGSMTHTMVPATPEMIAEAQARLLADT